MRLKIALRVAATASLTVFAAVGCSRDTSDLAPSPPNTDPIVFDDNYSSGGTFQAFSGSKLDAVALDMMEKYQGTAGLNVTVPGAGSFAGGAFTTNSARDLSGYNALTFWAKASTRLSAQPAIDVVGLGNNNTGNSKYEAQWKDAPITTTWTQLVIPIPLPAKLAAEDGLFFFAEAPENGQGYSLYLDEIKFETVGTITNPRPSMTSRTVETFAGARVTIDGTKVVFNVGGTDQTIEHSPNYFTFRSDNEAVATVVDGVIQAVGGGTATITAKLDTIAVTGAVTLNVTAPPAVAAPAPTVPAADVIALFSNTYLNNVPVDTWSAAWDQADVQDTQIAGNDVKTYTNLLFAGIEFTTQTVNATLMTHLHLDVWLPAGTTFKVKLVDFGADGVFSPAVDDREHELTFNAGSTPPITTGTWVALEIPLADFVNLTTRGHLAQLILSGDARTVYVDNLYFHK